MYTESVGRVRDAILTTRWCMLRVCETELGATRVAHSIVLEGL